MDQIVNIVTNIDNRYVTQAYVWLYSLAYNSNYSRNYKIYILSNNLMEENYRKLLCCIYEFGNISVERVDIDDVLNGVNFDTTWNKSSVVYYSNLYLHTIFPDMQKCIYMDVDMVVLHDMSELFDMSINACIAAVSAYGTRGIPNASDSIYIREELKINNTEDYFNNGTMLMNLDIIRTRDKLAKKDVDDIVSSKKLLFADQDVMNYLMRGEIYYLDPCWNVGMVKDYKKIDSKYLESFKNPYVIHYNGPKKPTVSTNIVYGEKFWEYARNIPFYEELLLDLIDSNMNRFSTSINVKAFLRGTFSRLIQKFRGVK